MRGTARLWQRGVVPFDGVSELLHARAFALGLAYGGIAFLLAATVAAVTRRRPLDFAALAFVAAGWLGVRAAWGPALADGATALALVVLALGGAAVFLIPRHVRVARNHPVLSATVALIPGAVLLGAVTPLAGSGLSRVLLATATVAIGVAIRDFDAMHGAPGGTWVLFAVSAIGVYLAVPDTELARVMLGVALPFVLLSVPKAMCPIGPAGSAALAGFFAWVVFVGGRGRPGSVVGGLACLGLLLAEPVGRRWIGAVIATRTFVPHRRSRRPEEEYLLATAVAGVVQLAVALYASQIVGREDGAIAAVVILAPAAVAAVLLAPMLYPRPPPVLMPRKRSPNANARHRSTRGHHSGRTARHRTR
jgi:hypothetical protein